MDEPPAAGLGAGGGLPDEANGARIPVVALSDAPEPAHPATDGWLTKPFELEALYGLARRWATRLG